MADLLWSVLGLVVIVLGIIYIHELGHYVIGRWVIGIPSADLKLVMTEFPQHVALRDDDEWVGPDEFERYSELYKGYDSDYEHLEVYIGAGELIQTLGVVIATAVLVSIELSDVAASIVLISLLMTGFSVVFDAFLSKFRGHPTGDFSGLWLASPFATVAVLAVFFVPHILIYFWI